MSKAQSPQARRMLLPLILYPFVAAAVAINLFMLGLAGEYLGLMSLPPLAALVIALPLGVPATWLTTRWVRRLIAEADA